jgi:F-type H+-transporting ATPase subunit b
MEIDWFTTGAQIVNFLILIGLLKKFLYRPVIHAMAARERNLAEQRQALMDKQAQAESLKQQYEASQQSLHREREKVLSEAKARAEAEKAERLQRLDDEIRQKKNRYSEQMRQEQQELGTAVGRAIAEKALRLGAKILTGLADQTLEQRIVEQFLRQLSNLPGPEQAAIGQSRTVTVITSFPVDETLRQRIKDRLNNAADAIQFEQDARLICGIALEAGGRSWEWNIERYLAELDADLLTPAGHEQLT